MSDSAAVRVKRQRQLRKKAGWHEVRLWVPTKANAVELQRQAASMRKPYEEKLRHESKLASLDTKISRLQAVLSSTVAEKEELAMGNRDKPKKETKKPKKEPAKK